MTSKPVSLQSLKNISIYPVRHTANLGHLFADFVELVSCQRCGDFVSKADLVKRFEDYNVSVPHLSRVVAGPLTQKELHKLSAAEQDDVYDDWATQVFEIIETRIEIFGDSYPFMFEKKSVRIRSRLSTCQQMYLMLLMCSNLPYFRDFTTVLTSDFEQVSFEALRNFLPDFANVRQLGKNSDYKGTAHQKILAIADELNVKVNEHELEKVEGNQERGLDVVGWIPFSDRYANFLCILGQCACGKDWNTKFSESRRFEFSYFAFKKLYPIHAMFIPRSLFHNKDFFQSDEICATLVFDRSRILSLISDCSFFTKLNSCDVVASYVDCFEDVV
jgi:hypothetical protein